MTVTEDTVEQAAIEWFEELGYANLAGPSIALGQPGAERNFYNAVMQKVLYTMAIDQPILRVSTAVRIDSQRGMLTQEENKRPVKL